MRQCNHLMTRGTLHVGARNASHKIVCVGGVDGESCEFYDLIADPLEEFPLAIPESCAGYENGTRTPSDEAWHYCRLTDIVVNRSFME